MGLAVMFFADASALSPIPVSPENWRKLRRFVKEDAQQVGCLKKLPVGTALFDKPDGEIAGEVIDSSIPDGKWDHVKTAAAGWSKLRVNVGFGPFELWIKDTESDWCD